MGEFRINDCKSWKHEGMAKADFYFVCGRGEDGIAGDFGPRAGGGWDCDDRSGRVFQRATVADDFEVSQGVAGIGEEGGDGLGGIERAASAKADEVVAFGGTGGDGTCLDVGEGGFAEDGMVGQRNAGAGELFAKAIGMPSGAAGDDEGVATQGAGCMACLLYTSPSPRDQRGSRMPSSA